MAKRTRSGQGKHDKGVLGSAEWYKGQRYNVKADLPEWEKPKTIEGRRPDFIAKKGKREIIGEIETKDSNTKDRPQHDVFEKYAGKKPGREFRKKIV